MAGPRVFLSYTKDLDREAMRALRLCAGRGFGIVDFRGQGPHARRSVDWCRTEVARSELVIALVGWREGSVAPEAAGGDGVLTFQELEIEAALNGEIPLFVLLADEQWPTADRDTDKAAERVRAIRQRVGTQPAGFFGPDEEGAGIDGPLLLALDNWRRDQDSPTRERAPRSIRRQAQTTERSAPEGLQFSLLAGCRGRTLRIAVSFALILLATAALASFVRTRDRSEPAGNEEREGRLEKDPSNDAGDGHRAPSASDPAVTGASSRGPLEVQVRGGAPVTPSPDLTSPTGRLDSRPAGSDSPPAREYDSREFTVSADGAWQNSGVEVEEGDIVRVVYKTGTWTTFAGGLLLPATPTFRPFDYPPTGTNPRTSEYRLGDSTMLGSMLATVGRSESFWEVITEDQYAGEFEADSAGEVQLRINDSTPEDNAGSVRVKIIVKPR